MEFYVYVCKVDGVAVYVGKGKGNRWKHCLSGKSHNRKLNEAVILGKDVSVELLKEGMSESEALSLENSIIAVFNTPFNVDKVAACAEGREIAKRMIAETGKTQYGKTSMGRPAKVDPAEVKAWREANNASITETAKHFGISSATVKRACAKGKTQEVC